VIARFRVASRLAVATAFLMFGPDRAGLDRAHHRIGLACPELAAVSRPSAEPLEFTPIVEWLHRLVDADRDACCPDDDGLVLAHGVLRARLGALALLASSPGGAGLLGAVTVWKLLESRDRGGIWAWRCCSSPPMIALAARGAAQASRDGAHRGTAAGLLRLFSLTAAVLYAQAVARRRGRVHAREPRLSRQADL